MRLPKHIGIIPDGNRRWAAAQGLGKENGYVNGLAPGMELFKLCQDLGIGELSFYGFTADNTKRPAAQRRAFTDACIKAVDWLSQKDASLLVAGNYDSAMFPPQLLPYITRHTFGRGGIKINFLINYSWEWDLNLKSGYIGPNLKSGDISRIDLIIRWGGRSRLSGFLPIQSAYADFYSIDEYWPDFQPDHLTRALEWYSKQEITLGG